MNGVSSASETIKFDMACSIQYLTTDLITQLCFGEPFGFVKTHSDVFNFLETLESRLPIVEKFTVLVEINTLISFIAATPLLNRVLPQPTDKDGIGRITGVR